jgi:hypothetical protein
MSAFELLIAVVIQLKKLVWSCSLVCAMSTRYVWKLWITTRTVQTAECKSYAKPSLQLFVVRLSIQWINCDRHGACCCFFLRVTSTTPNRCPWTSGNSRVGDHDSEISAGILGEKKSPRLQSKMKYLWDRVWLWAGSVSQDIFNLVFQHDLFAHQRRACKTLSNSEVLGLMLHRFLECQHQQPQGIGDICALSKFWSFVMIHVDRSLSNILLFLLYSEWKSSAIPVFIRRFSGYAISQNEGSWPIANCLHGWQVVPIHHVIHAELNIERIWETPQLNNADSFRPLQCNALCVAFNWLNPLRSSSILLANNSNTNIKSLTLKVRQTNLICSSNKSVH